MSFPRIPKSQLNIKTNYKTMINEEEVDIGNFFQIKQNQEAESSKNTGYYIGEINIDEKSFTKKSLLSTFENIYSNPQDIEPDPSDSEPDSYENNIPELNYLTTKNDFSDIDNKIKNLFIMKKNVQYLFIITDREGIKTGYYDLNSDEYLNGKNVPTFFGLPDSYASQYSLTFNFNFDGNTQVWVTSGGGGGGASGPQQSDSASGNMGGAGGGGGIWTYTEDISNKCKGKKLNYGIGLGGGGGRSSLGMLPTQSIPNGSNGGDSYINANWMSPSECIAKGGNGGQGGYPGGMSAGSGGIDKTITPSNPNPTQIHYGGTIGSRGGFANTGNRTNSTGNRSYGSQGTYINFPNFSPGTPAVWTGNGYSQDYSREIIRQGIKVGGGGAGGGGDYGSYNYQTGSGKGGTTGKGGIMPNRKSDGNSGQPLSIYNFTGNPGNGGNGEGISSGGGGGGWYFNSNGSKTIGPYNGGRGANGKGWIILGKPRISKTKVNQDNLFGLVNKWLKSNYNPYNGYDNEFLDKSNDPYYGPIEEWDLDNPTTFKELFKNSTNQKSTKFNDDISKWNVLSVKNFEEMFNGASTFKQPDIKNWVVDQYITNLYTDQLKDPLKDMFKDCPMSQVEGYNGEKFTESPKPDNFKPPSKSIRPPDNLFGNGEPGNSYTINFNNLYRGNNDLSPLTKSNKPVNNNGVPVTVYTSSVNKDISIYGFKIYLDKGYLIFPKKQSTLELKTNNSRQQNNILLKITKPANMDKIYLYSIEYYTNFTQSYIKTFSISKDNSNWIPLPKTAGPSNNDFYRTYYPEQGKLDNIEDLYINLESFQFNPQVNIKSIVFATTTNNFIS